MHLENNRKNLKSYVLVYNAVDVKNYVISSMKLLSYPYSKVPPTLDASTCKGEINTG